MPVLLLPPIVFVVMLALAWLFMWIGQRLAPSARPERGKYLTYACGEDLATNPLQLDYSRFFAVAFAYSTIHVSALTVLTFPAGTNVGFGALYLGIVLFSVVALVTEAKLV